MSTATISLPAASSSSFGRALRIFLSEARYDFVRALRTRTFSLSVMGFPIMFYVLFGLLMNQGHSINHVLVAKYMLGGYSTFAVVGASLFGIGVSIAADLSAGWLELKRASPMPPFTYLAAKCCSAMAFGVIIVSVLVALGLSFGHVHLTLAEYFRLLGFTVAGAIPFASLGLALALIVPFNSAPGVANLIYLPMSFCSGLWVPYDNLPNVVKSIAPYLPTFHLAQLELHSLGAPTLGTTLHHWLGLLVFTGIMLAIAAFAFRRREQNS